MSLPNELVQRVYAWVADDPDQETSAQALQWVTDGDEASLREAFDHQLEFGTAGLRGTLGPGPNQMNRAVVRRTTAGLCAYLLQQQPHAHAKGLVIGRDARRGSDVFAREAAIVAMGMGFTVHWFEPLMPTPLVAFAVQELGAAGGVMVTASHNPPEYNGYKVYWETGGQIVPPHDGGIADAIAALESTKAIPTVDREAGRNIGLFRPIADSVEKAYLEAIAGLDLKRPQDKDLCVAYTPLHGVGAHMVKRAFAWAGYGRLHVVAEQAEPDGGFPTVRFPNPEEPGAMDLVLALAKEKDADLVLANDPDANRLAVAYRAADGDYVMLTGNEIGVLLGHHLLADDPSSSVDRLVVTSLVSSPLLGHIAKAFGARYGETLTGFKWIAAHALEMEAKFGAKFVFGYEEALGSTTGTIVRDKDGVSAALVAARLAAQLKREGKTIGDRLDAIARQFGVWISRQRSVTKAGSSGKAAIARIMSALREKPPTSIGDAKVLAVRDYQTGKRTEASGEQSEIGFPPSNVLVFELDGGDRIIARPSGTEPKIKYYFDVSAQVDGELDDARAKANTRLEALMAAFEDVTDGLPNTP